MNGFYVSMVFLGIIFIVVSLAFIIFDKRSSSGMLKTMDEKNRDITAIINDAEQMTEELNKFSDYILTQIEEKNQELQKSLIAAEDRILKLEGYNTGTKAEPYTNGAARAPEADRIARNNGTGTNGINVTTGTAVTKTSAANTTGNTGRGIDDAKSGIGTDVTARQIAPAASKMSGKHEMVIKLFKDGLNETEIARELNMGKGEIQLILELNK